MILTILNSIGVLLCIYTLISKKFKTNDKRVAILLVCLNIIFIHRLWVVLDPVIPLSLAYISVNCIAFIALLLVMSLVKKDIVYDKRSFKYKVIKVFKPIKNKILKLIGYIKHRNKNMRSNELCSNNK